MLSTHDIGSVIFENVTIDAANTVDLLDCKMNISPR